jgi:hypothetical protein
MKSFANKEEFMLWVHEIVEGQMRENAEQLAADGYDADAVNRLIAEWKADAEHHITAMVGELERVMSDPDAPSHAIN